LTAAYKALVPEFERATGHKVLTAYGPSMGTTTNAIPVRLNRGEAADVLIMVGYALEDLAKNGKVITGSSVDLVKSPIGVAVKSGTPKPDISTADAVKRALLAAKTIAYSDSASGVYVSTEMFDKLGIKAATKASISSDRCRMSCRRSRCFLQASPPPRKNKMPARR
jgi:molybdate transport system substrate-binding protein